MLHSSCSSRYKLISRPRDLDDLQRDIHQQLSNTGMSRFHVIIITPPVSKQARCLFRRNNKRTTYPKQAWEIWEADKTYQHFVLFSDDFIKGSVCLIPIRPSVGELVHPLWAVALSPMAQGSTGISGWFPCPSWGWSQHPPPLPGEGPLPYTAAIQGQNASLPAIDTAAFHVKIFPISLGNKYSGYSECLSAAISLGPCLSLSMLVFETVFTVGTDRGEKPLPPAEVFF